MTHPHKSIDQFDPDLPIERASMPPSAWYSDPAIFEIERDAVFGRAWQPVARVAELSEPGSYAAGCFAGEPWVVVRGDDGTLRAFHNTCRHKGREVVIGVGRAERLVCGYHGWKYRLDGSLDSAPKLAGIQDFDREAMSLPALGVEIWGPWVFVRPDPGAARLATHTKELTPRLDAGGWDRLRYHSSVTWDLECNWKVYVDNYLDGGYHIPHMHPSLDAQIDMDRYRTELFERFSVQTTGSSDRPAGRRVGAEAIYAWIHPNFMINRYGPYLDSNQVIPVGPRRCRVAYEFYVDPTAELSDADIDASIEQSAVTQREDIGICESVQRGLDSKGYDRGRYAPRVEIGEYHFHRLLHADLSAGAARRP